ncbi:MAG: creatininase family protein [Candidatus Limnocylindria bacterium]
MIDQSVRFANLTYEEVRERAKAGALAVVPTGCTEQQGPHLPVGFDTLFSEAVAVAAAEELSGAAGIRVVVLPALPFGPTPEHRNYGAGYVDLPRELHDAVVRSVLESLADQGFRRIVLWRGCGGHDLRKVVEAFNSSQTGKAHAYLPQMPYHAIWCRVGEPDNQGGHADAFATSIALHLKPELVRRDRIERTAQRPIDWSDPQLDFARYSQSGVIGDPTIASAELGKRLWSEVIRETAAMLSGIALGDPDARR